MGIKKSSRALLLFTRSPERGKVKTRLQSGLGADQALEIHTRLLSHTLRTVAAVKNVQHQLYVAGDLQAPALTALVNPYPEFQCLAQYEGDLGARMAGAIDDALQNADEVVLIGSDCPAIDTGYLAAAFEALAKFPVVIGPASDGGYVLIACRAGANAAAPRAAPDIFSAMPWSQAELMGATRERLRTLDIDWLELETLADVDNPADVPEALATMARAADKQE